MTTAADVAEWLRAHDSLAILTHMHPDGDALGASLALTLALEACGKRAFVCCQDPAPDFLGMLPAQGRLFLPEDMPFSPQAYLYCDCAVPSRVGRAADYIDAGLDAACIDHHENDAVAANPALIDPHAAAAGELVAGVIDALGVDLSYEMALCLYVAVATDTGSFAFDSTTPACLGLAARCVAKGIPLGDLHFHLFRERSAARTMLLGRALYGMRLLADGELAFLTVRRSDFEACGADAADTEGIVNFGIDAHGVKIAVLAVERPGAVKFSLRSRGEISLPEILRPIGGGGHKNAAGVTLNRPFNESCELVLRLAERALR
ncbi:MAG: DHH family phosphoesterase [Clostridia bacterium]|nr:DHH family phosphoesterase [Clostridia bacterium]